MKLNVPVRALRHRLATLISSAEVWLSALSLPQRSASSRSSFFLGTAGGVLVLCAVTVPAYAQSGSNPYLGNPAIRMYNLSQVTNAPGLIDVPQGDIVTVQLPLAVATYVLAHQEWFHVELDSDTAYISALANNGRSTLVLRLSDGTLVRWVLNATKSGAVGKGITVFDDRNSGNYAKGTPMTSMKTPVTAAQAIVPASSVNTPISVLAPQEGDASSATAALQDALKRLSVYSAKRVTATLNARPSTREVEVNLTNVTAKDLTLSGQSAALWIDGEAVAVSAPNVILKANSTQRVLLRLSQDVTDEQMLRLAWTASDGATNVLVEAGQ